MMFMLHFNILLSIVSVSIATLYTASKWYSEVPTPVILA
jgi:hypothetical protein